MSKSSSQQSEKVQDWLILLLPLDVTVNNYHGQPIATHRQWQPVSVRMKNFQEKVPSN